MSEKYFDLSGEVEVYNLRGALIVTLYTEMIVNCADKLYTLTQQEPACTDLRSNNIPMEVNVKTLRDTVSEMKEFLEVQILHVVNMEYLEREFNVIMVAVRLIKLQLQGLYRLQHVMKIDGEFRKTMMMQIDLLETAILLYNENLNQAIIRGSKLYKEFKKKTADFSE